MKFTKESLGNSAGSSKPQEQRRETFGSAEQWRHVFSTCHHHWRRVNPHAAGKSKQTGGSATTSSPLPFLAGGENNVTCKATKSPQTVDLFSVLDLLLFCFPSVVLSSSPVADLLWSVEWLTSDSRSQIPTGSSRSSTPPSSLVGGEASRGLRRGNGPH